MTTEDFFLHGSEYPEENGRVRHTPCKSCAFVNTPETVRPEDVSIEELEAMTRDHDDFYCHCLDEGGRTFTCAAWHARFGDRAAAQSLEYARKITGFAALDAAGQPRPGRFETAREAAAAHPGAPVASCHADGSIRVLENI